MRRSDAADDDDEFASLDIPVRDLHDAVDAAEKLDLEAALREAERIDLIADCASEDASSEPEMDASRKKKSRVERIIAKDPRRVASKALRKGFLSVSDMSSLSWCESQVFYHHTTKVERERTAAMHRGQQIHRVLELEVMTELEVKTATDEDRWALRFLNMVSCLQSLFNSGIAREIPVLGRVGDFLVFGVIDEVRRIQTDLLDDKDRWRYTICDTKTRRARSIPKRSLSTANRVQVMLYRRLFCELANSHEQHLRSQPSFSAEFFFSKLQKLGPDKELGSEVISHCKEVTGEELFSLRALISYTLEFFKLSDHHIDASCELSYLWQDDLSLLESVIVNETEEWLTERLNRAVLFWGGKIDERELEGVEELDDLRTKCGNCCFVELCDWRARMHAKAIGASTYVPPSPLCQVDLQRSTKPDYGAGLVPFEQIERGQKRQFE